MQGQYQFGDRNRDKKKLLPPDKFGWLPIDSQPKELQDKFNAKLVPFQIAGPPLDLKESLLYKVVNQAAG